jgi:hypothetical protein
LNFQQQKPRLEKVERRKGERLNLRASAFLHLRGKMLHLDLVAESPCCFVFLLLGGRFRLGLFYALLG